MYVNVCVMCTYVYSCVPACASIYIMGVYICICVYIYIYTHTHYTQVCKMFVWCVRACMCWYKHTSSSSCIYTSIYIITHTYIHVGSVYFCCDSGGKSCAGAGIHKHILIYKYTHARSVYFWREFWREQLRRGWYTQAYTYTYIYTQAYAYTCIYTRSQRIFLARVLAGRVAPGRLTQSPPSLYSNGYVPAAGEDGITPPQGHHSFVDDSKHLNVCLF
jgi:hypothetical protein